MTQRYYYIGGAGPFIYDDEDIITSDEWGFEDGETRKGFQTDGDIKADGFALDGLTASRLLASDEDKKFVSVADLTAWIAGTVKQVIVTDNGDGTVVLSIPQDIDTDADVVFDTLVLDQLKVVLDNGKIYLGTGDDISLYYDGTDFYIKTDEVAASDLKIDCGTNKTIELVETVWEDLQFSVSGAKVPAANAPTWEALTANHKAYSFDVNDYKDQEANELPHWWKEGTDGKVHIHTTTKTANATGNDRFAKYTVYIAYINASNVWVEVSLTAELTIPDGTVAKQGFRLSMGTLTLTGLTLGTQIGCRIERIAATGGTEYADNMFITQVGIHLEKDTMGSRQEVIK